LKFELYFYRQCDNILWVWWGILYVHCLFTPLSNSGRILKIGEVFTKLSPSVSGPLFGTQCTIVSEYKLDPKINDYNLTKTLISFL